MGILSWIVVGAIAGWLSGLVMKGRGFGLLGDIIVGIIGGFVGGWLAGTILHLPYMVTGINFTSVLVAFVGALVVLGAIRLIRRI
jgi:uncharacterized membrane protein YeaQ/YmgE (transglycosylase-associated protein family)